MRRTPSTRTNRHNSYTSNSGTVYTADAQHINQIVLDFQRAIEIEGKLPLSYVIEGRENDQRIATQLISEFTQMINEGHDQVSAWNGTAYVLEQYTGIIVEYK